MEVGTQVSGLIFKCSSCSLYDILRIDEKTVNNSPYILTRKDTRNAYGIRFKYFTHLEKPILYASSSFHHTELNSLSSPPPHNIYRKEFSLINLAKPGHHAFSSTMTFSYCLSNACLAHFVTNTDCFPSLSVW